MTRLDPRPSDLRNVWVSFDSSSINGTVAFHFWTEIVITILNNYCKKLSTLLLCLGNIPYVNMQVHWKSIATSNRFVIHCTYRYLRITRKPNRNAIRIIIKVSTCISLAFWRVKKQDWKAFQLRKFGCHIVAAKQQRVLNFKLVMSDQLFSVILVAYN